MSIISLDFQAVHTTIQATTLEDESVLRVEKKDKLMGFDENTYAKLLDCPFHNGQIEVKLRSRLLPEAPEFARGFIGIAFRINSSNTQFESFYVRPTNGRTTNDPVRKNRAVQYFSYPDYTFDYFRQQGITAFEGPADIALDEWILLKAIIRDEQASFYLNNSEVPALVVNQLKLGADATGAIGLFVDIGTEGFFKDLVITPF